MAKTGAASIVGRDERALSIRAGGPATPMATEVKRPGAGTRNPSNIRPGAGSRVPSDVLRPGKAYVSPPTWLALASRPLLP